MSNDRAPQLYFLTLDIIVPGIMGLASGDIPALYGFDVSLGSWVRTNGGHRG